MKITCDTHGIVEASHLGNHDVMCRACYEDAVHLAMANMAEAQVVLVQKERPISMRCTVARNIPGIVGTED